MKKASIFFLLGTLLFSAGLFAASEGRFMSYPDIRGDKIVFTYEDDLWLLDGCGGTAIRLTNHPGMEYAAKFSPDGKWIAFTGNYDGGSQVYVMPADGGTPRRVTYRDSSQVITWTPDGRKIVFRASYENTFRAVTKLYAVSPEGEMPEKLPVPRGVLCSFSPDGKKMVYCPRGREEYYWKRYKGGQYQDIWLYDFDTKEFTRLTEYVGKNAYPMWIKDKMIFASDRGEGGVTNLYSYDFETKAVLPLTHCTDFDVQMASTDGQKIIYLNSGYLYTLDVATNQIRKVDIRIPTDAWQIADRTINPKDYIHSMSVTNDGKTAVFEARGDILLVPADEDEDTVNLTESPGTRERFPQVSPDGKWIAFYSDKTGDYELYIKNLETKGDWIRLTRDLKTTLYHLEWSPDSKKILFENKDLTIFYVDVDTKELVTVDSSHQLKNDEFYWEVSDYNWSPDSRWIVYSFVQPNKNNRIFLYNLAEKKIHPVTDDFYDNLNPSFDANGECLYFLSYRNYDVRMDVTEENHVIPNPVKVMVVQLKAGQKPPFEHPKKEKEAAEDESEDKKPSREKEKEKAKAEPMRIDIEGIQSRVFPLPVDPGNYFYLKAGKGRATWAARDIFGEGEFEQIFTPGGDDNLALHVFDMKDEKEIVFKDRISDWRLSNNREHMIIKKKGDYHVRKIADESGTESWDRGKKEDNHKKDSSISNDLGEKLKLDTMSYRVKPKEEWVQIFNDAWRWYRDFFYDPGMHGRDWKKIGDAYRAYIPQLTSREDLNWLLRQLVGELCVSHTYVWGGDTGPKKQPEVLAYTGLLGADLQALPGGYYRLSVLYGPTEYNRDLKSPLVRPDINVKEGDYLIAIDGKEIKAPENPYRHLQVIKGQKVSITVNSEPTPENGRTYKVEPLTSEGDLRYNRWLADNIGKVLKTSNGDLGYMHITAMGSGNVAQFDKFWRAFKYKKGIVIDVRGNGGGWTEYFIIDKLERKIVANDCLKNMVPFLYPVNASPAHYAVVSNEFNGSDGEAFVEHFKARKLGVVIGVPSWGGLVGIVNGQTTIDNGIVHQSNNAFYGREGKWLVENHGADPDILVENDPASEMAGRDRQLDTAIEYLMKKAREEPFTFPEKPPYPKK